MGRALIVSFCLIAALFIVGHDASTYIDGVALGDNITLSGDLNSEYRVVFNTNEELFINTGVYSVLLRIDTEVVTTRTLPTGYTRLLNSPVQYRIFVTPSVPVSALFYTAFTVTAAKLAAVSATAIPTVLVWSEFGNQYYDVPVNAVTDAGRVGINWYKFPGQLTQEFIVCGSAPTVLRPAVYTLPVQPPNDNNVRRFDYQSPSGQDHITFATASTGSASYAQLNIQSVGLATAQIPAGYIDQRAYYNISYTGASSSSTTVTAYYDLRFAPSLTDPATFRFAVNTGSEFELLPAASSSVDLVAATYSQSGAGNFTQTTPLMSQWGGFARQSSASGLAVSVSTYALLAVLAFAVSLAC